MKPVPSLLPNVDLSTEKIRADLLSKDQDLFSMYVQPMLETSTWEFRPMLETTPPPKY